jgi:uncharacterized membrane protein (DUF4010 family)
MLRWRRSLLSFTTSFPLAANLLLLLGLSLFFGLAFEEFHAHQGHTQPGGVRTFPLLALAGGMLYLLDTTYLIPVSVGVLVVGAWLYAYYRTAVTERDAEGVPNVGLTVPICNVLAYLLGPIVLAQPHWVAVGLTVTAVLLLTGRERLHTIARQLELPEIITAGKFLILTGIILPLLPNEPVTTLTRVTPYQAWLALLAVCTLSYASYLLQRYWAPNRSAFVTAILGGIYSSTATTVVLARRAGTDEIPLARAQVGITLATAVMYLRILAIIAAFNWSLAMSLTPSLLTLSLLGFALAGLYNWYTGRPAAQASVRVVPSNPLELSAAALFAVLFVAISIASTWAADHFGAAGVYGLAAIVGVTDIDPFVLSIAQGGPPRSREWTPRSRCSLRRLKQSIEGCYTVGCTGRRGSWPVVGTLILLSGAAVLIGVLFTQH